MSQFPPPPAPASRTRRFAPLVLLLVALVIVVAELPSVLNQPPQSTQETAEYAPVAQQSNQAPNAPNALGLGDSGGEGGSTTPTPAPTAAGTVANRGTNPTSKQCVGNPPRQSDDPLSPPCVPYFAGDNGGSTYQGVTRGEITVLYYFDPTTLSDESPTPGSLYDIDQPIPTGGPAYWLEPLQGFSKTFNDRYQTYGRHIHLYAYFATEDSTQSVTAATRSADAAANYAKLHPFAVENYTNSNAQVYLDYMAQHGVMNFGSQAFLAGVSIGQPESYYQKYPKLVWSFQGAVEQRADIEASYICTKIVPNPVSFSGNNDTGRPRKIGFLSTTDPGFPQLQQYAQLLHDKLQACGAGITVWHTFPSACCVITTADQNSEAAAAQNEADFKLNGITTIVWAGGLNDSETTHANSINYFPEWVLSGDHGNESYGQAMAEPPTEWSHAIVVTDIAAQPVPSAQYCYTAMAEGLQQPPGPTSNAASLACQMYDETRELVTGIQVAGPKLSPTTMDQGFRAIPAVASTNPRIPACYYVPGDYTCVKDAQADWYDPTGVPPGTNNEGCWRMMRNGTRYRAGSWPGGDPRNDENGTNDPCNVY